MLSTMHFNDKINQRNNKPEMINLYNQTKGGVDVVDEMYAQIIVLGILEDGLWSFSIV